METSKENILDLHTLQGQFFDELKRRGRSQNTLKNYKTDLDCFNHYLKNVKKAADISDFQIPQVVEYGKYLQNKYSSDNSRRRRVQALRIFFDFLVENKHFNNNPVRKIPTSPKFLDVPRPTPFIDVKTLWVSLLEESYSNDRMTALLANRNMIVMLLIYGAGLKVSDLSKLKVSSIFLDGETPRVLINHPKRDSYTIPLPAIFRNVWNQYNILMSNEKSHSEITFEEVLFNANPYRILSGGLSSRGLEIIFEELRKKLSIHLTPKSLRQACIFKWLQQGESDDVIKEWMGVAPSYSMKLYRNHLSDNIYNEMFLEELYKNHLAKA